MLLQRPNFKRLCEISIANIMFSQIWDRGQKMFKMYDEHGKYTLKNIDLTLVFFYLFRLTPGARLPVLGPFHTVAVPSYSQALLAP